MHTSTVFVMIGGVIFLGTCTTKNKGQQTIHRPDLGIGQDSAAVARAPPMPQALIASPDESVAVRGVDVYIYE